jgi:hypothetical protein
MAKKRSAGSGSNTMLIVTLVFFVLSTVILGVTTYFGFDGKSDLEEAKKKADKEKTDKEQERNWWRFQAQLYRLYLKGDRPADKTDAERLVNDKKSLDKGTVTPNLGFGNDVKRKEELTNYIKEVEKFTGWKDDAPARPLVGLLTDKQKEKDDQVAANTVLKEKLDKAEQTIKDKQLALDTEKKDHKDKLDALTKKLEMDKTSDRDSIDKAEKVAKDASVAKEGSEKAKALADAELAKEKGVTKALEAKVALLTKEKKEIGNERDDIRSQRDALAAKMGIDPRSVEAQTFDEKAEKVLKSWTKNWSIVMMDRKGKMPYINLGSADGLQPQVTFSIHSVGLDGRLNLTPKGTLEVVKIINPHLAQARITSVKDEKGDPVMKGDRLFNATWDPNRKRRIALAGIPDLTGDGTDNMDEFRRFLRRQNVEIDAYIDTKDEKAPKMVGKGITTNTDYLVMAEPLDGVGHPQAKNPGYKAEFERLRTDMRTKAATNGVTVVSLKKYLDMVGYRAPKVASSGANRPYGR